MIYTVTFNPALDYMVAVEHLTLGNVNRATRENIFYGGKGINVSVLSVNLGYRGTALDFIVRFTDRETERGVRSLGFDSDFIQVEKDMSYINVKLKSDQKGEINGMGPKIAGGDVGRFFQKLSYLKEGDVLILSGSISATIGSNIYQRIMEHLDGKGVRMAVDAEKNLLRKVLQYRSFLIKPNDHELEQMFGQELKTEEEIILHARELKEQGAVNVLVSVAGDGTILIAKDSSVHRQGVARETVKDPVGAGDSTMAGFIAGYLEKGGYAYILKLGTVCGNATAFSDDTGTKDETMRLLNTL